VFGVVNIGDRNQSDPFGIIGMVVECDLHHFTHGICGNVSPVSLGGIDRAADDLRELGERASARGLRVGFEALASTRLVEGERLDGHARGCRGGLAVRSRKEQIADEDVESCLRERPFSLTAPNFWFQLGLG